MFEGIRKCLDDFENTLNKYQNEPYPIPTDEEERILLYFNLHLAEELMKEGYVGSDKVAKIIMVTKGLRDEVKVKVE